MNTIKAFSRRRPLLTFFALTLALTWGGMAIVVGPNGFPISTEQLETAGPLVYLAMLVGPSVAGILLTALIDGRSGLRRLLSRLLRWRVGARWYLAALLTAPLLITTILLGLWLVSPEFQPALFASGGPAAPLLPAIAAGLAVGLFEELGWTGFAVPRLGRRYGLLPTGFIVGILWGAWHFPPFWESDTFSAALPLALLLARLFAWLPPYRILMVWVYGRTESLLVAVLMHASLMASLTILAPAELSGTALLTWIVAWAVGLWVVVAVVNVRRLWSQPVWQRAA
jgi:membrane protease YdiL (CAAX protease family)